MNTKNVPLDYSNSLMYELEKAFWDERGKGARFRMTKVGTEYFNEKVMPLLQSNEIEDILEKIKGVLQSEGITEDISFNREERLLKISVKGCIHRSVEERMLGKGVEPFTCIPANLIVLAIEEKLDIPVELAEIKVEEGVCQLLLVIFEKRPSLD
jgi:hypothetical protein